jgi:hypothetical protein
MALRLGASIPRMRVPRQAFSRTVSEYNFSFLSWTSSLQFAQSFLRPPVYASVNPTFSFVRAASNNNNGKRETESTAENLRDTGRSAVVRFKSRYAYLGLL